MGLWMLIWHKKKLIVSNKRSMTLYEILLDGCSIQFFYKQALISQIKRGCGLSNLELNSGCD